MLDRLAHRIATPQRGQSLAEYGIVLVLLSIAAVGVLTALGTAIVPFYSSAVAAF